ncbi:hypothetical protein [Burkholderia cenocepacia]|uniref:hypothetical protein n=1 Tax=Burkholderia cenocepacia TaxID=95486 RepID=UPI001B9087E1|nr:hypothetical protein [Burkholderia cenocepacia]MBR8098524.1 hypothetical protein [Burkholderia cenocepacia]MDI9690146.1 hypothetical protein [Burkholderia cenocepacia]HEP6432448.1 hypothetical protein [Burkholderia cenocepacia]
MIKVFKYRVSDGEIIICIIGATIAIGDQPPEDGYEYAYGLAAKPGQYYNAVTGAVQDGPLS